MLTPREKATRDLMITIRRALLMAAQAVKQYVDEQLSPYTDINIEEEKSHEYASRQGKSKPK